MAPGGGQAAPGCCLLVIVCVCVCLLLSICADAPPHTPICMYAHACKTARTPQQTASPIVSGVQEFSDWAQCQVLELVAHYTPDSEAEV